MLQVEDGNDLNEIDEAILLAKQNRQKPTLIEVKTIIGFGAPNKAGTAAAHGTALGKEERELVKKYYNWPFDQPFTIPESIKNFYQRLKKRSANKRGKVEATMGSLSSGL